MEINTTSQEKNIEDFHLENDLSELNQLGEGIVVWGANQTALEKQALKELEILAEENKKNENDDLEEGEIEEEIHDIKTVPKVEIKRKEAVLDINTYIKRQEELRKRQEYSKSLKASTYQKEKRLADEISNREIKKGKRRIKKAKLAIVSEQSHENTTINQEPSCSSSYIEFSEHNLRNIQEDRLKPTTSESDHEIESGSEYFPSDDEFCAEDVKDFDTQATEEENSLLVNKKRKKRSLSQSIQITKIKDDGCLSDYQARLNIYYEKLEKEIETKASRLNNNEKRSDEEDFHLIKKNLKVPKNVWDRLYNYQQDGIEWLWKLHLKPTGGILGDEMGLGKTVQVIAFLHALEFSKIVSGRFIGVGPSLLVCPVTVIHQWVQHFHEWAPEFRVAVLHQSGSFQGNKLNLIKEINKKAGILITTYSGILKYKGNLLEHHWHYVILDEGHKIRNPTAKVSIAVKEIRTPHRIMLTGSPMQNNLTELWSLFDFTNAGILGTLNTFQEHFINPILQGGFTNASAMQEATALSVASTLKKIIDPYLLRRSKSEVQGDIYLPNKTEQVLFCSLTQEQKDLYKGYLMSDHVNTILGRGINKHWYSENHVRANVLVAITNLRKICNHPDLYLHDNDENVQLNDEADIPIEERFGYYKRCGKMIVVSALLKIWKKQGHRVLLFTQGRAMIAVFQDFLQQNGYKYLKMDGSTSISSRQPLIDKFNQDSTYDVFLLTTRVGGLGVNLTGANRVIIYDPDWNPATDTQARERAWRIGQDKQVTIYRLLSAGTVEEKMYQRQVWKQLLSNKVLIDPKTHRFFKSSDLYDLFSLQESDANPETANIFHDSRVKLQENYKRKQKSKKMRIQKDDKVVFSDDKIKAMKEMAQKIAKALSKGNPSTSSSSAAEKTDEQLKLEKEREEKLKQKEELKKLSAAELVVYNRKKAEATDEEPKVNTVNDQETNVSFAQALELSLKPAKQIEEVKEEPKEIETQQRKKKKKKSIKVDTSGKIDGEQVEGLIKCETRKRKFEDDELEGVHNNYVLEKLFAKKGVSGALQHDSIVESGPRIQSLKVRTEAEQRADKALEALRKSRLDSWRW